MRRRLMPTVALLTALSLAAFPAASAQAATGRAESGPLTTTTALARAAAQELMKATGVTSMSLALVDGQRTVWSTTIGRIDQAGTRPSDTTLYGIGSVSKMLATISVMQLVDAGRVSLDAPVTDYITDFRMASPEYRQITVRMLLDHSAGLPGTDYANAFTSTPYTGYAQQVLDTLAVSRLKSTPGAMSVYCNDCFTLAGVLVERMSGLTYPEYVEQRILEPLGMDRSRYATTPLEPGSYAPVLTDDGPLPVELTSIYASGGLLSTPTEMGRLAAVLMNDGTLDGVRILSRAAVAEMGRSQLPTTLSPTPTPLFTYGLGWDSVAESGLAAVGIEGWVKGGDTVQYHAAFTLAPEQDLGAVILAAGTTVDSGTLEVLAQRILLAALAERGEIDAVPEPAEADAPAATRPTARQLSDISGIYLAQGTAFRVSAKADGSVRLGVYRDGSWADLPSAMTRRTDGRFWSVADSTTAIGLTRGWGRTFLVLNRPGGTGHYREDAVLGQKVTSAKSLSPAWQQRLGQTWLTVNERADSAVWEGLPTLRLGEIPGLDGYLWVADPLAPAPIDPQASDEVGSMFLTVPIAQGRDLNDLVVLQRDGAEWLRFGSMLFRPLSSVPELAAGTSAATIDADGLAQWRSIPVAGTVSVTGAGSWRLYTADGEPIAHGLAQGTDVAAPAGSLLVLFGDPGTELVLRHAR